MRDAGFRKITVQTNGRRLAYAGYAEELLRSGVTDFCLSVHGSRAAIHDALTRTPGSFLQTMAGLRNLTLAKSRRPYLRISTHTTLTRINAGDIPSVLDLLTAMPQIDEFIFNTLTVEGNAARYGKQIMVRWSEMAESFAKAIAGMKRRKAPRWNRVRLIDVPICIGQRYGIAAGQIEQILWVVGAEISLLSDKRNFRGVKGDSCRRCSRFDDCTGIYAHYIDEFGWDEFIPCEGISS